MYQSFIAIAGVTWFCNPSCPSAIRYSCTQFEHASNYARWLLLNLSLEADLMRGCF